MDFYSTHKFVRKNRKQNLLYDLFETGIAYRTDGNISVFTVEEWHEMRIDLIFKEMYQLEPYEFDDYCENIDIILYINNIDNPLNIKKGMTLIYPPNKDALEYYRINDGIKTKKKDSIPLLAVPNVSTKKDKNREKFKKGEYSLPPVATDVPKPPVVIQDGKIRVGGL